MQVRPYPEDSGLKVWLSRAESRRLVERVAESPKRELALRLGLSGLRSDEITRVARRDFVEEELASGAGGESVGKLVVRDGKTGRRSTPVSDDLAMRARTVSNTLGLGKREALVDVSTRTLRRWIESAREELAAEAERRDDEEAAEAWSNVRMHDLRRTWATDSYYSLAVSGVPIAEALVMGWGGWAMTSKGRETFREEYLGPEPPHVTKQAAESLSMI